MNPTRRGMTMMEVLISLLLFGVVMVAVLQSMLSTTSYVEFDASRTDLETDAMTLQNRVINDFANAAWFYRFDPLEDRSWTNPTTKERDPMYPLVNSDRTTIEFLKLRTSVSVKDSPFDERYAFTNFRENSTEPVDFTKYADAIPTPLMVMNLDYRADPQWFVASVWESNKVGLTFDENQDPTLLRHYLYTVEADATGTRNLVRKYLNGYTGTPNPADWLLDEILIREVSKVEFSTFLEDKDLNENQIKISVFLERKPQGGAVTGVVVKRQLNVVAAMRSINQEN